LTVTLTFSPKVEAGLLVKAQARGMGLQEYLQEIVEQEAFPASRRVTAAEPGRQEAVRRMLEFGDKYRLSLGEPITRESLHEGHRL
jgi:hypothetical protein